MTLNTAALRAQEEQLRLQAEETKQLVQAASRQAEIASQQFDAQVTKELEGSWPSFQTYGNPDRRDRCLRFALKNYGGPARHLRVRSTHHLTIDIEPKEYLGGYENGTLNICGQLPENETAVIEILCSAGNSHRPYNQWFNLVGSTLSKRQTPLTAEEKAAMGAAA